MQKSSLLKFPRLSRIILGLASMALLGGGLWFLAFLHSPPHSKVPSDIPVSVNGIWSLVFGEVGGAAAVLALLLAGKEALCRLRARREKELLVKQSRLLQSVLNAIPAPIYYKDEEGIYLGCNEAFEKYLGLHRNQIIGQTVYGLAPRDLADIYYEADQSLFRQGGAQTYETSVVFADGTRHEVLFHKAVFQKGDGSLGGLVGTMVDITDRKRAEEKARYLANFDPLTELPNQVLFTDRLSLEIAHAHRLVQRFAVFCLDLDHFKKVNSVYGHCLGNKLLKKFGERLVACLREDDTVARMGGDSFNLLLPNVTSEDSAAKIAQKILENLKVHFDLGDCEVFVTTSIGIAIYPYDGSDAATLLKNADTALQRAKERGRNIHHFFDSAMNSRAEELLAMEQDLRRAVDGNEFILHFQPQFETATGLLVGAETLIRWDHPSMGLVMPERFIQLAEQSGMISSIGEWVLRRACAQARSWQKAGLRLRVAVNLSPRQFQRPDLYRLIDQILRESALDPSCLSLEVTESVVMQDVDHAIETLVRLKNLGVHLAIDDFGTGYSSLSYLKRFPIDLLKIDRSFIMDIPSIKDDIAIVSAVIAMAHNLGIKVLAEGVQSVEQQNILATHKCDELQGFLFDQPLEPEEFFRRYSNPFSL